MRTILLIFSFIPWTLKSQEFYKIPKQEKNVFQLIDTISKTRSTEFKEFEISNEISLFEYWQFAESQNSQVNGQSLLPDKFDIPYMLLLELKEDTTYPAIGISWRNAMLYCKWKTYNEQDSLNLKYIYRLPTLSEWLFAYSLRDSIDGLSDFETGLSEWTLNSKDESFFMDNFVWSDYIFFTKSNDPSVLQRKIVIGNSWLYNFEDLRSYMNLDF